jgi:hypothetical protein
MARKWFRNLLLCGAGLILLPGCQLFAPPSGKTVVPPPAPAADAKAADARTAAKDVFSTANAANPITPNVIRGQDPRPLPNIGIPANTLPAAPVPLDLSRQPAELKPPEPGRSVTATVPAEDSRTARISYNPPQTPAGDLGPREEAFLQTLHCMFTRRNEEVIEHLKTYDKETQELLLRVLPALVILVKNPIDKLSTQQIAAIDDQFIGALQLLRPRSELTINKMCYCRNIYDFGKYDPLDDSHAFLAGSADGRKGERVQLYVELKNFASEPAAGGMFVTKLGCKIELLNANHQVVFSHAYTPEETTHLRKSRLNDFWSNYSFYVPSLPPGAYELTIHITDETVPELRRRVASKSLEFRVTPVVGQ